MRNALLAVSVLFIGSLLAGEVSFSKKPTIAEANGKSKISFAVSAKTDVEVAILDAKGKVVRHLAAGVLGGEKAPPAPLKAGLEQTLEWDGNDDFKKKAEGGPFKVRVRAGMGVKFGRFIGADPYNFGSITGVAADEDGNVYLLGTRGNANQGHMVVRVFDPEGRYLREVLPFPADLKPGEMKDVARWDEEAKTFRPRNLKSLNPDFYGCPGKWGGYLSLVAAGNKSGVVLTDGTRLNTLEPNGSVRGAKLVTRTMWEKKLMPWGGVINSGKGPTHLAFSPDGKYVYLAGIFASKTRYGHKYDKRLPPGRVYRMPLEGTETMKEFVNIKVAHTEGQGGEWLKKARKKPGSGGFTGAVHGLAVDKEGRVYVCDREHSRIAIFDEAGKEVGELPVGWPNQVAVHPETGAVYVMSKDCVRSRRFEKILYKFKDINTKDPVAKHDLGLTGSWPSMALSAGKEKTIVWVCGVAGGLVAIEDKGATLEPVETHFKKTAGRQDDWTRISVDYERDEIYSSDGCTKYWRYNGKTGEGGPLMKGKKRFLANDIEVGYDGLLYTRVSNSYVGRSSPYSGPLWRLTRELEPAPYKETGTHILSDYIYSRYGVGYAERGVGPGPNGECYISFMYGWAKYLMGGFGPDGKPIKGNYMEGKMNAGNFKRGQNKDLTSAVIGPMPSANGGIRIGLDGDIYTGILYWPKGATAPHGYDAKKRSWSFVVGSIIRFKPSGGAAKLGGKGYQAASFEGAVQVYPGLAPFSRSGFGGNSCCVCRVPRFDLDHYGRIAMPNAVLNSVKVLDNAGNEIVSFGRYGNFDSQFVNPNSEDGKKGKPAVATPGIPMAWPTVAGFSEDHVYVNDTYSRRVVRADKTWKAESSVLVK